MEPCLWRRFVVLLSDLLWGSCVAGHTVELVPCAEKRIFVRTPWEAYLSRYCSQVCESRMTGWVPHEDALCVPQFGALHSCTCSTHARRETPSWLHLMAIEQLLALLCMLIILLVNKCTAAYPVAMMWWLVWIHGRSHHDPRLVMCWNEQTMFGASPLSSVVGVVGLR